MFCFLIIYFGKRKPRKIQYISGNKTFLYFQKWKPWKTNISGSSFLSSKRTLWKSFLYFGEWSFLAPSLKRFYISGGNLQRLKNQEFQIFCLFRENSLNISAKEKSFLKVSYTFAYKERKISKSRYLFIIILKRFSHSIFFYTQQGIYTKL